MSSEHANSEGQVWLETLLRLMALPVGVTLEERVDGLTGNKNEEQHPASELHQPSSSSWLTINQASLTPEQITILTGPEGSVLDAMQYLVNTTLNMGQPAEQQHAYTIELNGYRARRQEELQTMAQQAADQVRQTGHEYELKSLSSAERRQVHMFLQSYPDLETYSRGREPDRRLVVRRPQDPAIEP